MAKTTATEAQILRAIMDYLAARRILAFRMQVSAMPTADGKRFIKAGVKGMADILAFQNVPRFDVDSDGFVDDITPFWLECKTEKGKQSDYQKSFQAQVEAEGHIYAICRSIDDVKELLA